MLNSFKLSSRYAMTTARGEKIVELIGNTYAIKDELNAIGKDKVLVQTPEGPIRVSPCQFSGGKWLLNVTLAPNALRDLTAVFEKNVKNAPPSQKQLDLAKRLHANQYLGVGKTLEEAVAGFNAADLSDLIDRAIAMQKMTEGETDLAEPVTESAEERLTLRSDRKNRPAYAG